MFKFFRKKEKEYYCYLIIMNNNELPDDKLFFNIIKFTEKEFYKLGTNDVFTECLSEVYDEVCKTYSGYINDLNNKLSKVEKMITISKNDILNIEIRLIPKKVYDEFMNEILELQTGKAFTSL